MKFIAIAGKNQAIAGMCFPGKNEQAHSGVIVVQRRRLVAAQMLRKMVGGSGGKSECVSLNARCTYSPDYRAGDVHSLACGWARNGIALAESNQSSISRKDMECVVGNATSPAAICSCVNHWASSSSASYR